ncbi:hypothetical protein QTI66_38560 [Variovorax sp. J22R133]|uniref:hypothetical protein n=1 Tax=Variovorax brevis TaxID=3053503 RepID=UPI00257871C6|nr:hypothetical protein [Variovorax sp. J22R133]MDM0117992.1 hypothetical protein [Variovorax sp. J22R133]
MLTLAEVKASNDYSSLTLEELIQSKNAPPDKAKELANQLVKKRIYWEAYVSSPGKRTWDGSVSISVAPKVGGSSFDRATLRFAIYFAERAEALHTGEKIQFTCIVSMVIAGTPILEQCQFLP